MDGFMPTLFDRLMGERSTSWTLDQLKASVARDLEALLNTRAAMPAEMFGGHPRCSVSVLNYGLVDFAGASLSSAQERDSICTSMKWAIARHESRLRNVSVRIDTDGGAVNRLNFVIVASLSVDGVSEYVNFNAVLQQSSLHYSISKISKHEASSIWTST
jgi:type VI secretion system protein ImpF